MDCDQPDVHRFLLEQGLDEDHENADRETPAEKALRRGNTSTFLYDTEAIAESLLFTALHIAVVLKSQNHELSSGFMNQEYAKVNTPDKTGMTPLHWASRCGNSTAVDRLLKWKADPGLQDIRGMSPLHAACLECDIDSVRLLLDAGCKVDVPDNSGRTALFLLREHGEPIIDLLVQHGADVDHAAWSGWTSLHRAASYGWPVIVRALVRCGADINALDKHGNTPMHSAIHYNQTCSVRALLESSSLAKVRTMFTACCTLSIISRRLHRMLD